MNGVRPRDIVGRDSDPQCGHRGDGGGWLHQCGSARAGNRARGRLRRFLERHHDAGGVQPPLQERGAGADRRPPLWPLFHGRYRPAAACR